MTPTLWTSVTTVVTLPPKAVLTTQYANTARLWKVVSADEGFALGQVSRLR